ncbi:MULTISPECIES: hypothetical protein [unclassified Olleya]|uniref:hypothetical protein n=1 Tax=unclassified Olleya TaxID=2615019 RepID=UPI000C30A331|nr:MULTISPECIES: hypothetical protein [unclassified Olleya]AUC77269.1 hypothetical protein CW732_16935 [Olleya sp. Bg11-27]QXP59654.1 hypothetical protein H0I26_17330 [Olleya sp. HaHaR_3_96]
MTVFESIQDSSNQAIDKGEDYLKKSHEYYKLKVFQQLTTSVSLVLKALLIGGLVLIGFVFIAVGSAIAIGSMLDSFSLGFLIVGLVFMLFSVVIYFNRKQINSKVIQSISKTFFD